MGTNIQTIEGLRNHHNTSANGIGTGFSPVNICLQNSSATFGDKVNVNSDIILTPNQKLYQLSTAATDVLNNGPKSLANNQANTAHKITIIPTVLSRGLSGSRFTRRTAIWTVFFLITAVTLVSLSVLFKKPEYGHFVTKKQWGAIPVDPSCEIAKFIKKPTLVIINHTSTQKCTLTENCITKVRYMQKDHINRLELCDIGYNFLVGGDGRVYEGRGFDFTGAHTKGYNNVSIGIGFIGEYITIHPTEVQLESTKNFLENAAKQGQLPSDFKVAGACQVQKTLSPGKKLLADLMTWKDRFTSDPDGCVGIARPTKPPLGYC